MTRRLHFRTAFYQRRAACWDSRAFLPRAGGVVEGRLPRVANAFQSYALAPALGRLAQVEHGTGDGKRGASMTRDRFLSPYGWATASRGGKKDRRGGTKHGRTARHMHACSLLPTFHAAPAATLEHGRFGGQATRSGL